MALGPVAEAFGVSEISAFETSISAPDLRAPSILDMASVLPGSDNPAALGPVIGPQPVDGPADLGRIATLSALPLLQKLSALPSDLLPKFIEANPGVVTQLLASPPSARMVTQWWGQLGSETKASLMQSAPQLVGNLEGVPYSMRNTANRAFLQDTIDTLNATINNDGRVIAEDARRQLHMLEGVRDALGDSNAKPQRTLLTLDVTGEGKAAIVLGDLRTADYVSYLIPGMFFAVDGQMGDWTDAAARLYDDQVSWLKLFAKDGSADANATVATVAWLGYETPNLTDVGGPEKAYLGRDLLARAVEGLQSMRAGNEPYVTLLAHSYGSTAALMALTEYDFQVDALAMVGSPGSAAQSVTDLHVKNGNVYVGEASWDPVPNSSFFGSDPGSASYGAKPMGVAGGLDIITHQVLLGSTGHNEYFSPGTESMRNMALIG
ncbi:MAG: alpha/beta hydrolase, partial [Rhodoglobus sp.]